MASDSRTGADTASSAAPSTFQWPREYSFPPFFTIQPNKTTRHTQFVKWSALVQSYCAHHRIFKLRVSAAAPASLPGLPNPTGAGGTSEAATTVAAAAANADGGAGDNIAEPAVELFANRRVKRRLFPDDAREVVDYMHRHGAAEWIDETGGGQKDLAWIWWHTPEQWAAMIEDWVDDTAQKGAVLTLYEIAEGEGTRGTELHDLDRDVLHRALKILVNRGKAQIFGSGDSQGVKFF
ncbi:uncharacterized protein E0L32_001395 [Thyridium curvatum]|uniref:ESCRT-II complex subunit VPS25 n=1 Tax=Thyridium curvatum TaxID=1093900 RepID=A0A507AZH9_9PEZI|nr:uncharacterized protein E0L32_001395 [Thyridium curvatum]TPX10198.1 hypothetical protein E0L32_001395 [Thyridium curvatum]